MVSSLWGATEIINWSVADQDRVTKFWNPVKISKFERKWTKTSFFTMSRSATAGKYEEKFSASNISHIRKFTTVHILGYISYQKI